MTQKKTDNQTKFSEEGAIFESEDEELLQTAHSRIKKQSFFQTKKGIIVLVSFVVLFLILVIGLILSLNGNQSPSEPKDKKVISETEDKDLSPLEQQLKELRLQLKQADPADKETPFPHVDMDISVELED
jgi:flagellar basal body-associated protein FliL